MNVYIPMAIGQTIPEEVSRSISNQTINTNIISCYSSGIVTSNIKRFYNIEQRKEKVRRECDSRNLAVELSNSDNNKYLAMQDRDIVHLYNDNYERCIEFLDSNLDYIGVALQKIDTTTNHILISAFVMRVDIFKQLKFRYDERFHTCATWLDDVSKFGKWNFLPSDKKLIIEIT